MITPPAKKLFVLTWGLALGLAALLWQAPGLGRAAQAQARAVRVVETTFNRGADNGLSIELIAQGNENTVEFSLAFDPSQFNFVRAAAGSGALGATFVVNASQVGAGRVGISLALPAGQTFAAGTHQIAVLTFSVPSNGNTNSTVLSFIDQPVPRSILDASAVPVTPAPAFTQGAVTLNPPVNLVPVISSLNPSSALTGSASFTLTINGLNFVNGSVVRWNGQDRATTFVSATQLTAFIPATDLLTTDPATVVVVAPPPGGGTSNAVSFTINNPAPTISSYSPGSAQTGGPAFTLLVTGTNFVPGAVVRFNGNTRVTSFLSATQLSAQILASDVATAGTYNLSVANPAPGGGVSNVVGFPVVDPNPLPRVSGLNPNFAAAGSPEVTISVLGTRFVSNSTARVNGAARVTTFVSESELRVTLTAADLAAEGTLNISVNNPAPGGGNSNVAPFSVTSPSNPEPTLASVSPNPVTVGGPAFALAVTGTNFAPTSIVRVNGADRPTTFVSTTQLTAQIPATDIAFLGTVNITVFSPAPGGGTSNAVTLAVTNPLPQLTSLSPNAVPPGGGNFTLTVNGTNFVPSATVLVNGNQRFTSFVSSTQLTAVVLREDIANPGTALISVLTPAPGGGISNELQLAIGTPPVGFEGDVSPRPNGNNNGTVTVADWVQVGRFAAGLPPDRPEVPAVGSEFQRADCAPRSTLGNGSISIADWVQAGRYAAVLDPATAAGGPIGPNPGLTEISAGERAGAQFALPGEARSVRASAGDEGAVTVELEARGDENALGFSLVFDPTRFRFVSARAGDGARGASLNVNDRQAARGRLGFALALPAGQTLAAGPQQVVVVTLAPLSGGGAVAAVGFGDLPIAREVVDAEARVLTSAWAAGARPLAVASAASFGGDAVALGSIATAFGTELAGATESAGAGAALPTRLAGTTVSLKDGAGNERLAPLFFVSPRQVNYLIPDGLAAGVASVTIRSPEGGIALGAIEIVASAPGLFAANAGGRGVAAAVAFRRGDNGSTRYEAVADYDAGRGEFVARPLEADGEVFLVLFGTGFRFGGEVKVRIDGAEVPVEFAGAQPDFAGLDQANVRLPRSLAGRGEVDVVVTADGKASNPVRISVK